MKRFWSAAVLFSAFALPQFGWMTHPGNLGYLLELPLLALFFWLIAGNVNQSRKALRVLLIGFLIAGVWTGWVMLNITSFALGMFLVSTILLMVTAGVTVLVLDMLTMGRD